MKNTFKSSKLYFIELEKVLLNPTYTSTKASYGQI